MKNVFILGKEEYLVDMYTTKFESEDEIIDLSDEEHKAFVEFHLEVLENNKNVIELDDNTVLIVNYTYPFAKTLFGRMVCNAATTKMIIAEMLKSRFKADGIDYNGIIEAIVFNDELRTSEDIQKWFKDQEEVIKLLKLK